MGMILLINVHQGSSMKAIALLLISAALAGCASTKYKEYVGGKEVVGTGGAREMIDGMEVWSEGTPNRKFRVVGIIDDERPGGLIPRATRMSDIVKKAKESGGDAIIVYNEGSQVAGFINNSFGSSTANFSGNAYTYGNTTNISGTGYGTSQSTGFSAPMMRLTTKAAVIKY